MEFDFYKNFIVIAEEGSITAAAKKLSLAQPALSTQVKTLEQYYKVKLIKTSRGIRQIELTEAGQIFLQNALRICNTEANLFTEMSNLQQGESGCLRFSISPGVIEFFMEQYLLPFTECYPKVTYQVYEVDVNTQIEHIENGISDFAFANAPLLKKNRFNFCEAEKEFLYLVYSNEGIGKWIREKEISLHMIAELPISCNFSCLKMLERFGAKESLKLNIAFTATSSQAAIRFAKSGKSVAVVFGSCLGAIENMMYQKLADNLSFEQKLFWSKESLLTACAENFLDFYKQRK